jgi:hypothetical protein
MPFVAFRYDLRVRLKLHPATSNCGGKDSRVETRRMSSTATVQQNITQGSKGARARALTPARLFFIVAAITMLTIMVAGFHPYYRRGEGMAGRTISPQLATLVFVHGAAMTMWLMLFLVQSLLVPARRLRLHMKLGWGGVAVALVAAGSGFMLAVESPDAGPVSGVWRSGMGRNLRSGLRPRRCVRDRALVAGAGD